ncbi:MotA/TolQ/ExbB proton channel family protein [Microbulbifer rhizosphaerae]|uniref:Biopolymer transport protein ExbB n=1 Tax=Microbulbifer rhizosphaerae TaxID=1562603 RepID=A0A7W4WFU0_9GAMM|nr:MotA/TolQ/ExbB proton channel family protein [Microbulbifer rhizosphaerae]MBB3062888.1 biopolymer transport protein ExbB [Microbulbifer rhizosphaerae]
MKRNIVCVACAAALLLIAPFAAAQGSGSLNELLEKIRAQSGEEAQRNREREAKFRAAAERQQTLLTEAQAEVARQEALRDSLRETFDKNEVLLGELQQILERRSGDLGELFGVFRQTADDTEAMIFDSLASAEKPERKEIVSGLAASTEVPSIEQMQALWQLLIEEIALSGTVSRFPHQVIDPAGNGYDAEVMRLGSFNLVADDKYLDYIADSGELVELARQPASSVRADAAALSTAAPGEKVAFTVDPSRGALLGMLVQSPSITERIEQGGTVGYAIILVGIVGLLIVCERLLRLIRIDTRMKRQLKNLDSAADDNPLGRIMSIYYENKHLDIETLERKVQEAVITDLAEIKRGLPVVKVLAAVAPLMGLLGTVIGMIGTFQAITLFGTGDPKLMAGGISQALVTTVLGLCAAIPLLLTHSVLSGKVTRIGKLIGERAAGLMAGKAEADALAAAASTARRPARVPEEA